jgi:hypothetical protein
MILRQHFKDKVDIIYYEKYTKITNSYLLNDEEIEKVASEIEYTRHSKIDWRCNHIRKADGYITEIKAHNKLYKMGIFKSHTIDTDLEEDQNFVYKLIYWLIGR